MENTPVYNGSIPSVNNQTIKGAETNQLTGQTRSQYETCTVAMIVKVQHCYKNFNRMDIYSAGTAVLHNFCQTLDKANNCSKIVMGIRLL
jgi:hypothetical protein